MLIHEDIQFRHGGILTGRMLQGIYDYPRDVLELQYADYSDGIITGLNYEYKNKELWLTRGILKYRGKFYLLKQDVSISQCCSKEKMSSGHWYSFYLTEDNRQQEEENVFVNELSLQIKYEDDTKGDGFFMGKILYNSEINPMGVSGITLPCLKNTFYKPFEEFTSADRMDLLNVLYAHHKEATYHPLIFAAIRKFLEQKSDKTMMDYALMMQLQNNPVVSLDTVRSYLYDAKQAVSDENKEDRKELFEVFTSSLVNTKFEIAQSALKEDKAEEDTNDDNSSLLLDDW